MKLKFNILLCGVFTLLSFFVSAQEYDGFKGTGVFQEYDNTYISPSFRGKHGVSIGVGSANVSPQNTFQPVGGAHLGYNYLVLYKRERFFGIKEVIRDEVKFGFGAHFNYWANKEWFLNFTFLRPFIKMRGKIISLYFFSEYGFGLHRSPQKLEDPSNLRFNVGLEVLRIRIGKTPLNLCLSGNYNLGSGLLSKERMDITSALTLRYYFYSRK